MKEAEDYVDREMQAPCSQERKHEGESDQA
jgi:hypothetical protein